MKRIRIEKSFTLYADCQVDYDGRAKSTLNHGNYLIIHKGDGTLLIHGGTLCTPRNYQPPGAILHKKGNKLTSVRKEETIVITIRKIWKYDEIDGWSNNRISITKTEKELQDYIVDNFKNVLGFKPLEIHKEFITPVGNIDILAIDEYNIYHIIEVKRGKASLASCSQLERYSNYFIDIMKNVCDYIASPDASSNAVNYMDEQRQIWLQINHKD